MSSTVVDDEDPRLAYSPPGYWASSLHWGVYNPINKTVHYTAAGLATVSLKFTSNYIGAYFLLMQTGGNFTVFLDGQSYGLYTTAITIPTDARSALLFEKTDLDPNVEHEIHVEGMTPDSNYIVPQAGTHATVNFDAFSLAKGSDSVLSSAYIGEGNFASPPSNSNSNSGSSNTNTGSSNGNSTTGSSNGNSNGNTGSSNTNTNTTTSANGSPLASGTNTSSIDNPSGSNTTNGSSDSGNNDDPSAILTPIGPASTQSSKVSTPAIVGGVLGASAFLLFFLAFAVMYRKRRMRRSEGGDAEKSGKSHTRAASSGSDPQPNGNGFIPSNPVSNPSTPRVQHIVPFTGGIGGIGVSTSRPSHDRDRDRDRVDNDDVPNRYRQKGEREQARNRARFSDPHSSGDGDGTAYTGVDDRSMDVNPVDSSGFSPLSPPYGRGNGQPAPNRAQGLHPSRPQPSQPSQPSNSQPSSAAPMTSNASLPVPVGDVVLRELIDLRAEVRRLTQHQQQANRGGSDASSVITDATLLMPPPLYGQ